MVHRIATAKSRGVRGSVTRHVHGAVMRSISAVSAVRHLGGGLFSALAELGSARMAPPRDPREAAHRLAGALGAVGRAHDLTVTVTGSVPRGAALIVANHVSYLDPLGDPAGVSGAAGRQGRGRDVADHRVDRLGARRDVRRTKRRGRAGPYAAPGPRPARRRGPGAQLPRGHDDARRSSRCRSGAARSASRSGSACRWCRWPSAIAIPRARGATPPRSFRTTCAPSASRVSRSSSRSARRCLRAPARLPEDLAARARVTTS